MQLSLQWKKASPTCSYWRRLRSQQSTVRSKYSNNSKLTKSELYETLSKGKRGKTGEKIKEREVEIEILTNSLESLMKS